MKTNTDAVLSAKSLRYFLQLIDVNMSYTQAAQIRNNPTSINSNKLQSQSAVGSPYLVKWESFT